jgi:hypothetical protein
MTLIQRSVELLPDKDTFDTPCPLCKRPLGEHVSRDQWEPTCEVTIDDLIEAGLARYRA